MRQRQDADPISNSDSLIRPLVLYSPFIMTGSFLDPKVKPYTTEEFNKQAQALLDLIAKCEELYNHSKEDKFLKEHFQIIDCR